MQQTEKRKFNIIETSDPFSPEALNENTRKVEAALDAHEAAVEAVTDGLDARVTVLERFKFACGKYILDGGFDATVDLGFTPVAVFVHHMSPNGNDYLALAGQSSEPLEIIPNGFKALYYVLPGGGNYVGNYYYIAFGLNQ